MKLKMKQIIILFMACIAWSCAVVKVESVSNKEQPKPSNCKLDVYYSKNDVKRKYIVACEIYSRTGGSLFANKSLKGAIKKAKPKVCSCGADALFVESSNESEMNMVSWGKTDAKIIAIKYQE